MAKYRKKPVVIEAWPVRDLHRAAGSAWQDLPPAVVEAYERGDVLFLNHPSRIKTRTLEGAMTANLDDFVIRGTQGELYPCKPGIFAEIYEAVAVDESEEQGRKPEGLKHAKFPDSKGE